jgi:hypothetical protein
VLGNRDKLLVDAHFVTSLVKFFEELELTTGEIRVALGLGENFRASMVERGEGIVVQVLIIDRVMIAFSLNALLLRWSCLLFLVKLDHGELLGGIKLSGFGFFFLRLELFGVGISIRSLDH